MCYLVPCAGQSNVTAASKHHALPDASTLKNNSAQTILLRTTVDLCVIEQKKLPPFCFDALELAAPYLKQGRPVPFDRQCPKRYKFFNFWRPRFVAKNTDRYVTIGPVEQAAIDSLGLTRIVCGMRDGTLDRFNPKGVRGQVMGNSTSPGTKCSICGMVCANNHYHKHLHVDFLNGASLSSLLRDSAQTGTGVDLYLLW